MIGKLLLSSITSGVNACLTYIYANNSYSFQRQMVIISMHSLIGREKLVAVGVLGQMDSVLLLCVVTNICLIIEIGLMDVDFCCVFVNFPWGQKEGRAHVNQHNEKV